jgi:hypothetical protein
MCVRIYNPQTDQETEDPTELEQMLGLKLIPHPAYGEINYECCLCQADVEKTVRAAGFVYTERWDDPMDVTIWPHGDYQI